MILIIDDNNIVIDYGENFTIEENGILLDNKIVYPIEVLGLTLFENINIPDYVKPQKYLFTEGCFIENLNYTEPATPLMETVNQMQEVIEYLIVSAFNDQNS